MSNHGDRAGFGGRRGRDRADDAGARQNRIRIAQFAARLIAEHGINDWSRAKEKAAHQLMLPDRTPLPSNEEIEQALLEHHALFGGEAHAAGLRAQREAAREWMRRLAQWHPLLVGGVAAGWASAHSDVRLELVADDPKHVEIGLAGAGVAYVALPAARDRSAIEGGAQLLVDAGAFALRIAIVPAQHRRNRPREDAEHRLSAEALDALLASDRAAPAVEPGQAFSSASQDAASSAK